MILKEDFVVKVTNVERDYANIPLLKYEVNDQKYNMNHHRIPELKEGK